MKIFILDTDLFSGRQVLEDTLKQLGTEHEIARHNVNSGLTDDDWDRIIQGLASADRVITL